MNILGVGVDIIKKSRIKKSSYNTKFIHRIFSKSEINNSIKIKDKISYFSKRFAAKEAFSKALGLGFRYDLNFNDISVVNDRYGKPSIKMNKKIKKIINKKFKIKNPFVYLSLSDEKNHSIAFVVLCKK